MRFFEFRNLVIKEADEKVTIIVYFDDNTSKEVTEVPLALVNSPDFLSILKDRMRRKFNKVVVRFARAGEDTSAGNPQGQTPDTNIPPVMTSTDGEEEIPQAPDTVATSGQADQKDAEPTDQKDAEPTDTAAETPPVSATAVELVQVDSEGYLLNPDGSRALSRSGQPIQIGGAEIQLPKVGGGKDGEEGESGEQGGGLPAGEAEAFAERLYNAFRPGYGWFSSDYFGTNEREVIEVFRLLQNKGHFTAVANEYQKKYDENLLRKLEDEFTDMTSALTGSNIGRRWVELVNKQFEKLGFQLDFSKSGVARLRAI